MKKNEVKKAAKKSKTSKPNVICGEVAPQKPERNERQPTSLNQENLGRCQNIDQSQLSISTNTIENMRDVNRDVNKKNQTFSLPIDRKNPPIDLHAMQQPSLSCQFNQIYSHPHRIDFRTPETINSVQNSNMFMPTISKGYRQTIASSPSPVYWHSGLSPHPYEVVEKAKEVVKCYGCSQNFENNIAFNLVIKHIDTRIRGKDSNGPFIYNSDFTPAYYHPILSHILHKNPYFDGRVQIKNFLYEKLGVDNFVVCVAMSELNIVPVTG